MKEAKEWAVFIGAFIVGILLVIGLIGANLYVQKWIHSPTCNCTCARP